MLVFLIFNYNIFLKLFAHLILFPVKRHWFMFVSRIMLLYTVLSLNVKIPIFWLLKSYSLNRNFQYPNCLLSLKSLLLFFLSLWYNFSIFSSSFISGNGLSYLSVTIKTELVQRTIWLTRDMHIQKEQKNSYFLINQILYEDYLSHLTKLPDLGFAFKRFQNQCFQGF